jgi:hypothetical protein
VNDRKDERLNVKLYQKSLGERKRIFSGFSNLTFTKLFVGEKSLFQLPRSLISPRRPERLLAVHAAGDSMVEALYQHGA